MKKVAVITIEVLKHECITGIEININGTLSESDMFLALLHLSRVFHQTIEKVKKVVAQKTTGSVEVVLTGGTAN